MKKILFIILIFSKSNLLLAQTNGSNVGLKFVNFNNEFKKTNNYKILNSKLDSLNKEDFASYAIEFYFKKVVTLLVSHQEIVFDTFSSSQIDSILNHPSHQIENYEKIYELIEYESYMFFEIINVQKYSFFIDKKNIDDYKFRIIFILKNNSISSMLVSLISFEDLPNESTEINEKKQRRRATI